MSYKCPKCSGFAKYNKESNTFFCEKDGNIDKKDMLPVSVEEMILISMRQAKKIRNRGA